MFNFSLEVLCFNSSINLMEILKFIAKDLLKFSLKEELCVCKTKPVLLIQLNTEL